MNPDVELIARSIARDPRAFGDLFDRHSNAVYRFAYSLTHDHTEAQELVQETFVTTWKRLADIRLAGDSVLPWLLVTTRNHARNLQRAHRRHDALPLDELIRSRATDQASAQQEVHDELAWALEAVRSLSETDQRIVELCLFEGYSYKEAAVRLGLTVGAVEKRLQRTRQRLRHLRNESQHEEASGR